jgi:predicted NBD/HSP70 family sugar kinase
MTKRKQVLNTLGIDLGGTKVKFAMVDKTGNVLSTLRCARA